MCSRLRFPSNQSPHTKRPKMDAPTASRMAPTKNRASKGTRLEKMSVAVAFAEAGEFDTAREIMEEENKRGD